MVNRTQAVETPWNSITVDIDAADALLLIPRRSL
jgi:hypothetical protein